MPSVLGQLGRGPCRGAQLPGRDSRLAYQSLLLQPWVLSGPATPAVRALPSPGLSFPSDSDWGWAENQDASSRLLRGSRILSLWRSLESWPLEQGYRIHQG